MFRTNEEILSRDGFSIKKEVNTVYTYCRLILGFDKKQAIDCTNYIIIAKYNYTEDGAVEELCKYIETIWSEL